MNIDHFLATHQESWARLAVLTRQAMKSGGKRRAGRGDKLDAVTIDELIRLYQRASTHLSYSQTNFQDPALNARLTTLVADAQSVIYGTQTPEVRAITRFFTTSFPGAVWHLRRFIVISAVLTFLPALAFGAWISVSDKALDVAAPKEFREAYLEEDFEDYYSSEPAAQFSSEVFINNAQVGFMAFGAGIGLCVPTALILGTNGINLGLAGGLFTSAGQAPRFWGLILPHGLLELTGVVIAGAAGLALGWSIIAPGDRSRARALAEEARRSVVLVIGLVAVFFVAGLIEGFVTGQTWPTFLRVSIGVVVWAAFCAYIGIQGAASIDEGLTGTLEELNDLGLKT